MKLLIINDGSTDAAGLVNAAGSAGWEVPVPLDLGQATRVSVGKLHPDALVFVVDRVDQLVLDRISEIYPARPLPILIMTGDSSEHAITAAVRAGVTSFVVDCPDPGRIGVLLDVARARFADVRSLREELDSTRTALSDRKYVEKAKGILMSRKLLSEDEAYRALRKLAMDKNKRLGEIAQDIITAADVLI